MTDMGLYEAVTYMVVTGLAKPEAMVAIIKYYTEDASPSDIAKELFKTNNMRVWTRGYIQRLKEKAGNHRTAAVAVSLMVNNMHLLSQHRRGRVGSNVCPLCGKAYERLSQHIRFNHKDVVQSIVSAVLSRADR